METKYEKDNTVTYEVFTNINAVKKFLYATDSLEDLIKFMKSREEKYGD